MTDQWFTDAAVTETDTEHLLARVAAPEVKRVWDSLGTIKNTLTQLEPLLQDELPAELVHRIERTVLGFQGAGLGLLLEKTPKSETPALINLLEQSSWRAGKSFAQQEWKHTRPLSLTDALSCLRDSPLGAFEGMSRYLVVRATRTDLQLQVRSCAHHSTVPEVKKFAGTLCTLHARWVSGFVHALLPEVHVDHLCGNDGPYCSELWSGFSKRR